MRNRLTALGLSALLLLFVVQGCSNDDSINAPNEQQPPGLPSTATMTMNLSFFESAEVSRQAMIDGMPEEIPELAQSPKSNFVNAAVRSFFLQVIVFVALVEPVCAFEAAVHSIPQPQPDGSWLWTYIFVNGPAEYNIYLYGTPANDYVEWRMEVSSTNTPMPLDHFVWFDGIVDNNNASGYWQFYEPADEGIPVAAGISAGTPGIETIRIDWEHRPGNENETVFLLNKPGIPEEGSTLTFYESPSICSIDFHNTAEDNYGSIIWYPDGSGSIEWPDYNEGVKSCWNTNQYNVECQ